MQTRTLKGRTTCLDFRPLKRKNPKGENKKLCPLFLPFDVLFNKRGFFIFFLLCASSSSSLFLLFFAGVLSLGADTEHRCTAATRFLLFPFGSFFFLCSLIAWNPCHGKRTKEPRRRAADKKPRCADRSISHAPFLLFAPIYFLVFPLSSSLFHYIFLSNFYMLCRPAGLTKPSSCTLSMLDASSRSRLVYIILLYSACSRFYRTELTRKTRQGDASSNNKFQSSRLLCEKTKQK